MPPLPDTDPEVRRHEHAARWETLCQTTQHLMTTHGLSQNAAARQLGVPPASLCRAMARYATGGYEALLPRQKERSGRPSVREALERQIGAEALVELEKKVVGTGLDMDGSDGAAWRRLARRPDAPLPLKEYFAKVENRHASKHSIARSLRAATRITPGMMQAHRGPRALALRGAWTPRYCDIVPGDIFGPDDTTPIWGYYTEVEACEKYPHGYKVGQGQFLPMLDVASQGIVSYALILRETSAYRASDVWRLIGHTHRTVGVPRLGYQMERGSWEAGLIRGVEVTVGEGDFAHARRVGGLRMLRTNLLPLHIERMNGAGPTHLQTWTSYLPKSKSIEGAFHRMQRFEGVLWGSLGRDQMRRPFEKAKKIYEACKRGAAKPPLHFLSLAEISRKLLAIIDEYMAEPIQGEVFRGRPREAWERGIAEHGELLPPPVDSGFLYRSDWACVTVSRGLVRVRRQNHELGRNVSYYYESPELFARQDVDGRQVLLYFDRDGFETPADVVSLTGEWLGHAHYYQSPGMFLDGDISGHEERRASREAVTAIYQSVLPHIPSRQVPAEIAARRAAARESLVGVDDGRGRAAWATVGGQNPLPSPANTPTDAAIHQTVDRAGDGTSFPRPSPRAAVDTDALAVEIARQEAALAAQGIFLT